VERIRSHAGLGARSVAPGTVSAATSAGTPWQIEAAVSDFISALNDYNRADQPAWRVETAWSAVLAGDIDDLREHLSGEESALGG
jgi:hypothetical protein